MFLMSYDENITSRSRGKPSTAPPPRRHGGQEERDTQREPFAIAFGNLRETRTRKRTETWYDFFRGSPSSYHIEKDTDVHFATGYWSKSLGMLFLLLLWLMFAYILRKTLEIFILLLFFNDFWWKSYWSKSLGMLGFATFMVRF